MLNKYFGKIYDYPEFAARIREGEFSTFMDVIHAWEASYGGTALRVDGKLKDGQVGVSPVIAEWTKVMKHATDGLRWYFCNKAGLWVEGGHDAGFFWSRFHAAFYDTLIINASKNKAWLRPAEWLLNRWTGQ